MLQATLQVLLYAVVAGLSPLAFAATISVMQAGRPRALAFAVGFVVSQLLVCSAFVVLGVAVAGSGTRRHAGVEVVLEFAVALALLWLARRVRQSEPTMDRDSSNRTRRLLERLGRLQFATALAAGLLLGTVSPKRLVLAALSATVITTAGVGESGQAALIVAYVAVGTALVWAPVTLYVVMGERAVQLMKHAQVETARHQPGVTSYALLLLAALFAVDGVSVLVTQIL